MTINKAIFYIKYYAEKHDCEIERKATLDNECYEGVHKTKGYPYKIYVDVDATKERNNGKNQYRCASKKWKINDSPTI
tara:strand:+ start:477 stop:710 length:234 start_codon:yes stop_codon:yes gene_type:complete